MGANRYAIREQTPGRFQARWYDDAGKRRSKTFRTKTAAKKFLDGMKADVNRGDYIDPNEAQRTFREVAELWFQSRNLRPKTAKSYRTILDQRIYPTFADRPVGGITTLDIVAWITELSTNGKRVGHNNKGAPDMTNPNTVRDLRRRERERERIAAERKAKGLPEPTGAPLAAGTVRNAVRVMNQVMDAAVRARYLRGNPCNGLTRDDLPRPHTEPKNFLNAAQVEDLAQAMRAVVLDSAGDDDTDCADALALLIRFAAQTGLRAGEMCALRWENVDLLRGRVTVSESISTVDVHTWHVVPPKNSRTRVVPLRAGLMQALQAYAQRQGKRSAFGPDCFVWPSPTVTEQQPYGQRPMHWGRDFYLTYWKKAVVLAGLPSALRAHDLRHTTAALLIAANVPAKAIQEHLGHSSFSITMDTYGHLYEDNTETVTNALDAAFESRPARSNVSSLPGRWKDRA
ncbi:tyrosine-type recombinase/integrase [Tsukamurella strandjordii]|uniref:Tyrosine-type recombinase/integrase n=1 Tax=Tsukamurella strandjordii TaxID=147577 RepID=A0AA90NEC8_9ACTN|nr:site-specific integrase [Tsukamurella strandjordii]MDP0400383.1 tyrosine-type recombinase/integrase [Tsukamurella strandjordii]